MNVLAIDVETTGLDTSKDRIIEIGAVVWDVEEKAPLDLFSSFVLPPPEFLPLKPEIIQITGIKETWLQSRGLAVNLALSHVARMIKHNDIKYILAHNGENYDKPLILAEAKRSEPRGEFLLEETPWIDTRTDIPFDREPSSRRLTHLATDHGFINPFEHRAVFDCLTMMKIVSKYDFEKIIEQSKVPWVVVRALVDYDNRDKAKEQRFSWENLGDKKYPKMWIKKVRENMLVSEIEAANNKGFKVVKIE